MSKLLDDGKFVLVDGKSRNKSKKGVEEKKIKFCTDGFEKLEKRGCYILVRNTVTDERKWVNNSPVWDLKNLTPKDVEQRRIKFWDADPHFVPG